MSKKELDLGHLAEEFSKILTNAQPKLKSEEKIQLEEGERREMTILFLDLVGYTKLAEKLDAEQLKFIASNTLQVFTNQIKKFDGTIENYIGDAILALFGRSQTREDDSMRAVYAAQAILESVEDINSILASKEIGIKVRIGINRGLVVTGHLEGRETITGESINIAQRLESNAPHNGILISDSVYKECKDHFECEHLNPLHVKNKEEALDVYRVKSKKKLLDKNKSPSKITFVGRDGDLATIKNLWEKASENQMSVIQITGEAGMGKRSLVHHFINSLKKKGIDQKTINVSADSFGLQPYHALSDLVLHYLKNESIEEIFKNTPNYQELKEYEIYLKDLQNLTLSETEKDRLKNLDPQARQIETTLALKRFIKFACMKQKEENHTPLVIVLDNVEWFSETSQKVLSQIIKTLPQDLNLFWIILARKKENLTWVPDRTSNYSLNLSPLTFEATCEFLNQCLQGRDLPLSLSEKIYLTTKGNPFFLQEVSGILDRINDFSTFDLEKHIPGTIKALVLTLFDFLPRYEKFALQIASLAGREFNDELFNHIRERVGYTFDSHETINSLIRKNIIEKNENTYLICQPMMTEVAYSTILHTNRKKLHQLVASWVEKKNNSEQFSPYLARQWESANNKEKAIHYYLQSGHSSRSRYAYRDACHYFEKVLEFSKECPHFLENEELINLYLILVEILDARGIPEKMKIYLDEGIKLTKPQELAYLKFKNREIVFENRYGDKNKSQKMLEDFINSTDLQNNPELYLKTLLTQSSFLQEKGENSTSFLEKAVMIREEVNNRELLFLLDNHVFNIYKNKDELKKAESYLNRVLISSGQNSYTQNMGHLLYASFMWDRGNHFEDIADKSEKAMHYFREVGWVRGVGWGAFYKGAAFWRMGDLKGAYKIITSGLQELEAAKDNYMIERLELLLAAVCLFKDDTMGYNIRKKRILERAKSVSPNEELSFIREFAMQEAQINDDLLHFKKIDEELFQTENIALSKVQHDEFIISKALVKSGMENFEEAQKLLDEVKNHIIENEKQWLLGLVYKIEGRIASGQKDFELMKKSYQKSIAVFEEIKANFDCYHAYKEWLTQIQKLNPNNITVFKEVETKLKNSFANLCL